MFSSLEQELCAPAVDSLEPTEVLQEEAHVEQGETEVAPEEIITEEEPVPEQPTEQPSEVDCLDPTVETEAPEPTVTPTDTAPEPKSSKSTASIKIPPPLLMQRSRIPSAVFKYYLQFGFTPDAVHAILHSAPKDLSNKKVSFVPITPPTNC